MDKIFHFACYDIRERLSFRRHTLFNSDDSKTKCVHISICKLCVVDLFIFMQQRYFSWPKFELQIKKKQFLTDVQSLMRCSFTWKFIARESRPVYLYYMGVFCMPKFSAHKNTGKKKEKNDDKYFLTCFAVCLFSSLEYAQFWVAPV